MNILKNLHSEYLIGALESLPILKNDLFKDIFEPNIFLSTDVSFALSDTLGQNVSGKN